MLTEGLSFESALNLVKEKRPIVRPNAAFSAQVLKWEKVREYGVNNPILYRVQQHHESSSYLVAKTVHKFKKEDLRSNTCCVLHTPKYIYLWQGSNTSEESKATALKHVQRLQKYEKGGECIEIHENSENNEHRDTFYSYFP
eukprot:c18578_g1_i1.p1 GENE.c18578_g1_i1~~c18578_g1_i1.p1  ORF type:complete len:142 (-),score=48.31 c18578_g1_i1:16-441(-)